MWEYISGRDKVAPESPGKETQLSGLEVGGLRTQWKIRFRGKHDEQLNKLFQLKKHKTKA